MKSTVLWALVLINAALLLGFLARVGMQNSAYAQPAARGRGDYVMIPAEVNGQSNAIVYVVDTTNATLSAIVYDENKKSIDGLPLSVDLNDTFSRGPGNGPRR